MFVVTFNVKFMVLRKLWSVRGLRFQELVIHAQF